MAEIVYGGGIQAVRARRSLKKKKVVLDPDIFKTARGQYMPSPRRSQLFNPESLAPNWYKHTTI